MGEVGADSQIATFLLARPRGRYAINYYMLSMCVFHIAEGRSNKKLPTFIVTVVRTGDSLPTVFFNTCRMDMCSYCCIWPLFPLTLVSIA
jgi:hypothetical protein